MASIWEERICYMTNVHHCVSTEFNSASLGPQLYEQYQAPRPSPHSCRLQTTSTSTALSRSGIRAVTDGDNCRFPACQLELFTIPARRTFERLPVTLRSSTKRTTVHTWKASTQLSFFVLGRYKKLNFISILQMRTCLPSI